MCWRWRRGWPLSPPASHTMLRGLTGPGAVCCPGEPELCACKRCLGAGHSGIVSLGAHPVLSWAHQVKASAALSYYVARLSNASCLDQDTPRNWFILWDLNVDSTPKREKPNVLVYRRDTNRSKPHPAPRRKRTRNISRHKV